MSKAMINQPSLFVFILIQLAVLVGGFGLFWGVVYAFGMREATKTEYESARVYSMYSPTLKDMAQEALEDGVLTANEFNWICSEFIRQIDKKHDERKNKELQEAKDQFTNTVYKEE